ncbi:MAG: PT domain-containing protein [Clostridia bacterium]|nr:PT domain-containing protein [Clostridia bacterium]
MKPKSAAALLLSLAMLLFCACAPTDKQQDTPEPTAEATAAPTDKPTAVPTDAPTDAPTAVPTEEPTPKPTGRPTAPPDAGEMPSFPGAVQLGNLIGGELFPEPGMYFVLNGESDLKYVYDRFGELVSSFNITDYEDHWLDSGGFFGEHGAPWGYSIERGENLPDYRLFGDLALIARSDGYCVLENGEEWRGFVISDIRTGLLEEHPLMNGAEDIELESFNYDTGSYEFVKARGFRIGEAGGILHIDGKYLVIERYYEFVSDSDWYMHRPGPAKAVLFDENGARLGEVDTAPFGTVRGVFGGKYIIGERMLPEEEWYFDGSNYVQTAKSLYTLSGELVMDNVEPIVSDGFAADEEIGAGWMICASYLKDREGGVFNSAFESIEELPADAKKGEYSSLYRPLELENRVFVESGVYVGIKDDEGNWLFRIYNPNFASDSQREDRW